MAAKGTQSNGTPDVKPNIVIVSHNHHLCFHIPTIILADRWITGRLVRWSRSEKSWIQQYVLMLSPRQCAPYQPL
jgi:hypothetical protein